MENLGLILIFLIMIGFLIPMIVICWVYCFSYVRDLIIEIKKDKK